MRVISTIFLLFIVVIYVFLIALCHANDEDNDVKDYFYQDKSDWVDPGNMFTYDAATKTNVDQRNRGTQTEPDLAKCDPVPCTHLDCHKVDVKLETCQRDLASWKKIASRDGCDHRAESFLRRLSLKAVNRLNNLISAGDSLPVNSALYVQFPVSLEDLKSLQAEYGTERSHTNDCIAIDKVADVLSHFLDKLDLVEREHWYTNVVQYIPACLMGLAILYILYALRRRFIFLFLFACTLWEWLRLYKNVIAKRQEIIAKVPIECFGGKKPDLSWYHITTTLNVWFKNQVSFDASSDVCAEYYKSIYVDPIFEANPAKALSEVFGMIFLYPIELLGNYTGLSVQKFFKHIPGFHLIWIGPLSFLSVIAFLLALSRITLNSVIPLLHSTPVAILPQPQLRVKDVPDGTPRQRQSRRDKFELSSGDSSVSLKRRRFHSVGDLRKGF